MPDRSWSIRAWLGSLVAVVAVPLLLLMTLLVGWQLHRDLAEAREAALRAAKATAGRIEEQHDSSAALLKQLAQRPNIRDFNGRCDSLFALVNVFPQWSDLLLYDRAGGLVCSQRSSVPEILRHRPDTNHPTIRLIEGRWISVVTQAVTGSDASPRGTLVLLQQLDFTPREALPPNTVITILDRNGTVLARSIGPGTISRQYGFTQIVPLGWTVSAGVPTGDIVRSVWQTYLAGTAGVALIILLIRLAFKEMLKRRSAAESRTRESERNLKALSESLLNAHEQERLRIAREIHDDLGQALTALKMDIIGLIEKTKPSPEIRPMVDRILRTVDSTVTAVQRISSELRPGVLDDLGLYAAIEAEALLFEERTGIECELSLPDDAPDIDKSSSVAIYRIVQEALTNVARHSNAGRVEIRIRQRTNIMFLEIRDDGRGITPAELANASSLGLAGIRERADMIGATALIEGVPGRGTIVSIRIPLGVRTGSEA